MEVAEKAVGKGFCVDRFEKMDRPVFLSIIKPGTKKFKIILDAHLDVVPERTISINLMKRMESFTEEELMI